MFRGVLGRGLANVLVNAKAHWEPDLSAIRWSRFRQLFCLKLIFIAELALAFKWIVLILRIEEE